MTCELRRNQDLMQGKGRKGKKSPDIPQEKITGVILTDGTFMEGDAVIVATGGFSYQSTGSTGDGYRFARELGLKVTDIAPSLVPLKTKEDYVPKLQGLSLKNTGLTIKNGKKVLYEDFGEMMFTHFGVTGPMILSASAHIGAKLAKAPNGELSAYLDLKPALTREQLDARILREFEAGPNKQFKNVIGVLFPSSLTPVMLELGGIPAEKKIHDISREERQHFIDLIKASPSQSQEWVSSKKPSSPEAASLSKRSTPEQWNQRKSQVFTSQARYWIWMQ